MRDSVQCAILLADHECMQVAVGIDNPIKGVAILSFGNRSFVEGNVLTEQISPLGKVSFGERGNRHGG